MDYKLTSGTQSNYQIALSITTEEMASYKEKALQQFQKEMKEPGFREGHVPLDIVEKKVNPAYVEMGMLEEVVHAGTKQVIEENKEIRFIGNIYDLNRDDKDNVTTITFFLDIYPDIVEKNQNWQKIKLDAVESTPTPAEIDETLTNLRKQYADYQPSETITTNCVFKVKFAITDKDGTEVDTGSSFLGKEEMEEFPIISKLFVGKKNNEEFTEKYNEKEFPPMLHSRNKEGATGANIKFSITDVREVVLPNFTPENIKKFFGNDDVTTEEGLREKISELIEKQKKEMLLMQTIDKMLGEAQPSFEYIIPKTLIDEEMKTRMKSLEERMGGEEGMKQYFEKVGEEEQKKMMEEVKGAAKMSLEKFFLLKEIVEKLGITDPDWKTPMDVETKVYDKLINN